MEKKQRSYAMNNRVVRIMLRKRALYLMMIPGIAFLFVFNYMPMYGAIIAFKDFQVKKGILGSPWADPFYRYFQQFFESPLQVWPTWNPGSGCILEMPMDCTLTANRMWEPG